MSTLQAEATAASSSQPPAKRPRHGPLLGPRCKSCNESCERRVSSRPSTRGKVFWTCVTTQCAKPHFEWYDKDERYLTAAGPPCRCFFLLLFLIMFSSSCLLTSGRAGVACRCSREQQRRRTRTVDDRFGCVPRAVVSSARHLCGPAAMLHKRSGRHAVVSPSRKGL